MADSHPDSISSTDASSPVRRIRISGGRLLILFGIVNTVALIWIWFVSDQMRQQKLIHTTIVVGGSVVLYLLWMILGSKLLWKTRLGILGVLVVALVLSRATLRIEGVSGDLVPIVTWRWMPNPDAILGSLGDHDRPGGGHTKTLPGLDDYPQFLGPHRNATLSGINLSRDWSKQPPRLVWRQAVGAGWSSFAVVGGWCVTQEQRGPDEMVVCYDVMTGEVQWAQSIKARYETTIAGIGPRATPTIDADRIYTLGATGILQCLDLNTGQHIWSTNILDDTGADLNEWGMSGSPLLVDHLVIVNAGGPNGASLVAYDRSSGDRVWSAGDDRASYSSPLVAELAGLRQIVVLNQTSVVGHDPYEGRVLWETSWPGKHPKVAQPVPLPGNRLFVSCSYGVGCAMIQIGAHDADRLSTSLVWKNMHLKAKFTNVVYRDGFIYGLDEAILTCLDADTGERRWKRGRYGHGQLILIDDLLLVQTESGQIVLVEASPQEHRESGRFSVLEGKTWNSPALAGRYLLVRNDREAACYELPVSPE